MAAQQAARKIHDEVLPRTATRHIAVVGAHGQGKSSLVDWLLSSGGDFVPTAECGIQLLSHETPIEARLRISVRPFSFSLFFSSKSLDRADWKDRGGKEDGGFALHIHDCPGHPDMHAEAACSMRLCDTALIVVRPDLDRLRNTNSVLAEKTKREAAEAEARRAEYGLGRGKRPGRGSAAATLSSSQKKSEEMGLMGGGGGGGIRTYGAVARKAIINSDGGGNHSDDSIHLDIPDDVVCQLIRQAASEKMKILLAITGCDQLLNSEEDNEQVLKILRQVVTIINNAVAFYYPSHRPLSAEDGDVLLCSSRHGWGFTLPQLARTYAAQFGVDSLALAESIWKGWWFLEGRQFEWLSTPPIIEDGSIAHGWKMGFEELAMKPIRELTVACEKSEMRGVGMAMKKYGIPIINADFQYRETRLAKVILNKWRSLGMSLAGMLVSRAPNPAEAQPHRIPILYEGPHDDSYGTAMKDCSLNAPLFVFLTRRMIDEGTATSYAVGRIYSGQITQGQSVRVLGAGGDAQGAATQIVGKLALRVANVFDVTDTVSAGHLVFISGIDNFDKNCTLMTIGSSSIHGGGGRPPSAKGDSSNDGDDDADSAAGLNRNVRFSGNEANFARRPRPNDSPASISSSFSRRGGGGGGGISSPFSSPMPLVAPQVGGSQRKLMDTSSPIAAGVAAPSTTTTTTPFSLPPSPNTMSNRSSATVIGGNEIYPLRRVRPWAPRVINIPVRCGSTADLPVLVQALRKLSALDALCEIAIEETGVHLIKVAGELHRDVCLSILSELMVRSQVIAETASVALRETVIQPSDRACIVQSPNRQNSISVRASPLVQDPHKLSSLVQRIERGDFASSLMDEIAMEMEKKYGWRANMSQRLWAFGPGDLGSNALLRPVKDESIVNIPSDVSTSTFAAFQWATREGPLADEQCLGVCFDILNISLHSDLFQRGSSQILAPMRRVFHASVLCGEPRLVEPIYDCLVICPKTVVGAAENTIKHRRGRVIRIAPYSRDEFAAIEASIPVSESFGLGPDLRSHTGGRADLSLRFRQWQAIPWSPLFPSPAQDLAREIRLRKGMATTIAAVERLLAKP